MHLLCKKTHMKSNKLFTLLGILIISSTFAQTRVVLVEQFTNSGCPPCAASSPSVFSYVNSNPADVVAIAYHTPFPYSDSMYYENPSESNARVSFYGVSGVPYSIVDGNYYSNSSGAFVSVMSSTINTRKTVSPKYDVQALSFNLTGNLLTGSFKFTSLDGANSSDNLVAQIVVIEKNVLKSSYAASPGANSETEYGYVMRKMLPNQSGTVLLNKTLGSSDTINLNWTLNKIKDINELRLVTFVQNTTTKEVYQAQLFTPQLGVAGIAELNNTNALNAIFYPNPSTGNITISLATEQFINKMEVISQLGELVYSQSIGASVKAINTELNLSNGIYYVKLSNNSSSSVQKLSILK
jgi:thiol-disulfide isomerase/thioredoxin